MSISGAPGARTCGAAPGGNDTGDVERKDEAHGEDPGVDRGSYAYVDAIVTGGDQMSLFRLKYVGYASQWGFAIYRARHDDYQRAVLPGGWHAGTPEDTLDTACGLYFGDPAAWLLDPRRTSSENH